MKETEKKVYDYIIERTDEGIPPSIREICAALDIKSTSTAARYVNALVEHGLLEKVDGRNRAIKPAGKNAMHIPLVEKITSETPASDIEDVTEYINFHPDRTYSGKLFAVKLRDSSMAKAGILDGDIIVVEQCGTVNSGDIAAVLTDGGEAVIRRFGRENGHCRLQPENDDFEPIISDNCKIIGKAAAIIRYL